MLRRRLAPRRQPEIVTASGWPHGRRLGARADLNERSASANYGPKVSSHPSSTAVTMTLSSPATRRLVLADARRVATHRTRAPNTATGVADVTARTALTYAVRCTRAHEVTVTVRRMDFGDVVRKRRMVHVFQDQPVDTTLIDALLDVARRGPSAGFSQGTDFVVLDQPTTRQRFWDLTADPKFPREPDELHAAPPVLISS